MVLLLLLSLGSLFWTSVLWLESVLVVRERVSTDSKELGRTAYSISSVSMMGLIEQNYIAVAENRAQTIDASLSRYLGYVNDFAFFIHRLYDNPEEYLPKEILPPDADKAYTYVMQLVYAKESPDNVNLSDEIGLLANSVHAWQPVMERTDSRIGAIYLCTESGFMINYDLRSDLTSEYWDYTVRDWYTVPRDTGETIITDAYPDAFGRGLMVTCSAPFYNDEDKFAGVVCIDLMIDELGNTLADLDLGDGSYAYLVDGDGRVIMSPNGGEPEFPEGVMSGESGGEYSGDEEIMYYAYSPIASADWRIVFRIPSELIIGPSTEAVSAIEDKTESTLEGIHRTILAALMLNLVAIVVVVAVVAVISRLFAKQLTGPLFELGEDVKIISGGNLEHRAEIRQNDELGDLARSFNDMAASLDEHIRDLTRVTAERERIGAELDVAKHIQASMLPCIFPAFPERTEFDIYATMNPAKEVGGDFYDFFMVDRTHLAIVMADVSGKGVPAALFMVIGKTLIKDHTGLGNDLGGVFSEVNNLLCASNSEGLFITAFEGVLDLVSGEFRFVNAGHEMPFISHAGGEFKPYKIKPGFVLAGMEDIRYKAGSFMLEPGDKIFQYTDGVTEATDVNNQLYGMERLEKVLTDNRSGSPQEILEAVKEDIDRFCGEAEQFDDITMLALEYKERFDDGGPKKEITVEADIEKIPEVTEFVNRELEKRDCPPKAQMQIDIAIDELCGNIARYAYTPKKGMLTVGVSFEEDPLAAVITFTDCGVPYDPLAKADPDVTLSAEDREIGGLGIFMVKKSMDDMKYSYTDGRNILTIKKKF